MASQASPSPGHRLHIQPLGHELDDYAEVFGYYDGFPKFTDDPFGCRDFSRKQRRKFLPRLGVAVVWILVCAYINNLSQAWLQKNIDGFYESNWGYAVSSYNESLHWLAKNKPDYYEARWGNKDPNEVERFEEYHPEREDEIYHNKTVKLFDIVFLYLPYVNSSVPADCFAAGSAGVAVIRFAVIPGPISMRWTILTRWLIIWGFIFLCRAGSIIVTPLPNPYQQCVPKMEYPDNIWLEAFALVYGTAKHSDFTCQDVMFSGHTAMGTLSTWFFMRYLSKAPWFRVLWMTGGWLSWHTALNVGGVLWMMGGWYVIAGAHFHYTVDVFVGILMVFGNFALYHTLIKEAYLQTHDPNPAIRFLNWLEKHSPDLKWWSGHQATERAGDTEAGMITDSSVETVESSDEGKATMLQ